MVLVYQFWLFSLSYALSALFTIDISFIFDILFIIVLNSILSFLVFALLILTLEIICFKLSAPIDSFAYLFLNLADLDNILIHVLALLTS